jgi:hypothetical protein
VAASSILTADELASVRREYRSATLLPKRTYHDAAIYDWPSDAVAFWDLTNQQDWHVCDLQQRGTSSSSWVAGRYSNQEASVHAFDRMVADRYAGESISAARTVRERYDVPPPKDENVGSGPRGRRIARPKAASTR